MGGEARKSLGPRGGTASASARPALNGTLGHEGNTVSIKVTFYFCQIIYGNSLPVLCSTGVQLLPPPQLGSRRRSAPGQVTEIGGCGSPLAMCVGRGCCPQPFRILTTRASFREDGSKGWDALSCSLSPTAATVVLGWRLPEDTAPGTLVVLSIACGSCPGPAFRQEDETGRVSVLPGSSDSDLLRVRGPDQVRCLRGCAHCSAVVRPPVGWWSKVADATERETELGTTVSFPVTWALAPRLSLKQGPPGRLRIPSQAPALRSPGITAASGHRTGLWKCALWTVSKWRETDSAAERWDGPNRSGHRACAPARVGVRACVTVCARVCESRH
ncbi:hypothetical protein Cadr_000030587 [Camelus dromedarius]|uniref:Uncharacterized protein n=1 Tax=Camelus dromedarius TaxID=9838 RepID=A0A5N4C5S3_CAMDR|nr:hypothetical protein Cadr_000030587 [Camelus dromedarius]